MTLLNQKIQQIFQQSYQSYGTRRIRQALRQEGLSCSRRYISRVMRSLSLVSKYQVKQYKARQSNVNNRTVKNMLNREFSTGISKTVLVPDLTYIRVGARWHYLCILVDISSRKIVGQSAGRHKNAELVMSALSQVKQPLWAVSLFHSDRGSEFNNALLDECFDTFNIERSLSRKGCPYDNAVAEATFKTIKTEFVQGETFNNLTQLQQRFAVYADWYNYRRLHSSLGYLSPVDYCKQTALNFIV